MPRTCGRKGYANELKNSVHVGGRVMKRDRSYVKDDVDKLNPGDIMIGTNIIGRGTDFGLTPILFLNGGLHVIVTFLPSSRNDFEKV